MGRGAMALPELTSSFALEALSKTAACKEQRDFFEAFVDLVFRRLEAEGKQRNCMLVIAGDLSRLELDIVAELGSLMDLAQSFLDECGIPSPPGEGMYKFQRCAAGGELDRACLWCRLKGIGTNWPVADVGFNLTFATEDQLPVSLLPQSRDFLELQRYAIEESLSGLSCGSSLLPSSTFPVPGIIERETQMGSSAKMLLSGLALFRHLRFDKPDDMVIRTLSSCRAKICHVRSHLSADGLTQLSLRLEGCVKSLSPETINALGFKGSAILDLANSLGRSPDLLDYARDANGSSLAMGYSFL